MSGTLAPGAGRMRVLAVSNLFPSPVEPHRATYNRQQFGELARLVDLRVAVPVYWHQWRPAQYPDAQFEGVPATYFPYFYPPRILARLHGPAMAWSLLAAQRRAAREFAPHVVFASWLHPDAYGALRLARYLRVPLVVKVHGNDANVLAEIPARRAQIARVLATAHSVIAVSAALRQRLLELGARPQSTCVVYNGVDRTLFRPGSRAAAKARLELEPHLRYVLYVGNLKVTKGCEDLLRAVPALRSRTGPNVRFVFAGSGPERTRIVELAETLGVGSAVHFVGAVAHDRLPDWYRAADLVCLPSHAEGVPNVLLEAMACGVPIVATRVGGIPEVVPSTAGILIEPHDVDALANALADALAHGWASEALITHASQFDWRRSAAAVYEVLARAAGHEAGPGAPVYRSAADIRTEAETTHQGRASG